MSRDGRAALLRWRDVAAAAAFGAVWFGGMWWLMGHGWLPQFPEAYVVAGVATVLVLLARAEFPRTTFGLVVLLYPQVYSTVVFTDFHLLPIVLAAYTVTATGRLRLLWTVLLAELAVTRLFIPLGYLWRWLDTGVLAEEFFDWNFSRVTFAQASVAAVILLGVATARQRRATAELRFRNAELSRLRRVEADQVVAAERTRIARELHDVVAHHISAVVIRAQAADRVADARPEEARIAVRWIAASGQETLAAMRHVVRVLRSGERGGELAPQAGLADLAGTAERMAAVGLPVELRLPERLPVLPAPTELAAVRIVQEALTNVLVHAVASRALVVVAPDGEELRLEVHDDGTAGPPPDRVPDAAPARPGGGGHGLIGMRERAISCGGSLGLGVSPLGGWQVTARLSAVPLSAPGAGAAA